MKTMFTRLFNKIKLLIEPYKKNIIIPLLKIVGIIILCAIIVRFMAGNETLLDYANNNPEKAYQTSIGK